MNDYCQRFHIVKDMNGDLVFSISDVWLIIKFVWLLPAKVVMSLIQSNPKWATFFEIDCSTGDSWGGGLFSLVGWFVILALVGAVLTAAEGK